MTRSNLTLCAMMFSLFVLTGCVVHERASQAETVGEALGSPADPEAGPGATEPNPPEPHEYGTSGVDPSKMMHELTGSERRQLCEWTIDVLGGGGREEGCQEVDEENNGITSWFVMVNTVEQCMDEDNVFDRDDLSVEQSETCTVGLTDDLCVMPPACEFGYACIGM